VRFFKSLGLDKRPRFFFEYLGTHPSSGLLNGWALAGASVSGLLAESGLTIWQITERLKSDIFPAAEGCWPAQVRWVGVEIGFQNGDPTEWGP
jgi:hypothetical protein